MASQPDDQQTDAVLASFRKSIDNIDAALIHMLAERFRITKEVGAYKARTGMAPADPGREEQQIKRLRSLAEEADLEQMRWFLLQEVAGEAGFEDLVAMAQVRMPDRPKLELARNYWDEMGRGSAGGMHGPMLKKLADHLDLRPRIDQTVWPALALGNLLVAFSTTRRYAFHALGALGVVELTAPWRAAHVAAGLKRLGVGAERKYYALHATLDVEHSRTWNEEVLRPLAESRPEVIRSLAEGAVMRLMAGADCFDAYRAQLWGTEDLLKTA